MSVIIAKLLQHDVYHVPKSIKYDAMKTNGFYKILKFSLFFRLFLC